MADHGLYLGTIFFLVCAVQILRTLLTAQKGTWKIDSASCARMHAGHIDRSTNASCMIMIESDACARFDVSSTGVTTNRGACALCVRAVCAAAVPRASVATVSAPSFAAYDFLETLDCVPDCVPCFVHDGVPVHPSRVQRLRANRLHQSMQLTRIPRVRTRRVSTPRTVMKLQTQLHNTTERKQQDNSDNRNQQGERSMRSLPRSSLFAVHVCLHVF